MKQIRLEVESLDVVSFPVTAIGNAIAHTIVATEPVETEPNTWEDTCVKMCPTDDTCTMLGCTRTA